MENQTTTDSAQDAVQKPTLKVYEVLVIRDASYTCWVEATSEEEAMQAVWDIDHNCPTHFDGDTVDGCLRVVEDADFDRVNIDITYAQIVAAQADQED